jgi:exodeoxyribonuclease-3
MKLLSWNVNGVRATLNKGLIEWMEREQADVVCLQETKAREKQVDVIWPEGYTAHWHSAEKAGYSGTLTLTRRKTLSVQRGLDGLLEDKEGRVLTTEFDDFFLVNCYTPNAKRELERLPYRHKEWDPAFLKFLKRLETRKPVVFCGDLNVAHEPIDLAIRRAMSALTASRGRSAKVFPTSWRRASSTPSARCIPGSPASTRGGAR